MSDPARFKSELVLSPSFSSSASADTYAEAQIFFYLYISCLVVSSCYTLVWDLKMDWGLFDRNAGENTFLREEIVYPHKVCVLAGWVGLQFNSCGV